MIAGPIAKVFEYVRENPGVTAAALANALGYAVPIAGANLRALRTMKFVSSRGNTKGTRYYPRAARKSRGSDGRVRYSAAR